MCTYNITFVRKKLVVVTRPGEHTHSIIGLGGLYSGECMTEGIMRKFLFNSSVALCGST